MSARSPKAPRAEGPVGPWDPIRDLMVLKDRMNRLLENVLRRGDFSHAGIAGWSPAVDLREDREVYVLVADLPGVRREDIHLRVEGGVLTLEGRRPPDRESRSAGALRIERSYGPFTRSFHLPSPVDESKVTARYRLGVLEVLLPKSTEARARATRVQVT
jgi:HSP20 family protein